MNGVTAFMVKHVNEFHENVFKFFPHALHYHQFGGLGNLVVTSTLFYYHNLYFSDYICYY